MQDFRHAPAAFHPGAKIVRTHEQHAPRVRHIRVHADHGDTLRDGGIDRRLEQVWLGGRHQDPRRLLGNCPLKRSELFLRRKRSGTVEIRLYAHLGRGVRQTCLGLLPVRQIDICGDEKVMLSLLVIGRRTAGDDADCPGEQNQKKHTCRRTSHGNPPLSRNEGCEDHAQPGSGRSGITRYEIGPPEGTTNPTRGRISPRRGGFPQSKGLATPSRPDTRLLRSCPGFLQRIPQSEPVKETFLRRSTS